MTNNDIARKIVDRMTEVIDKEGYLPWTKPWADAASVVKVDDEYITVTAPVRFWSRSGKAYTGVNPHILALSGHTGEFITFNQAKAEGGKVRKGAKGWPVVYWSMIRKDTGKVDADGNPVYSMTHYGEMNADAMADPDLTFAVDFKNGTVIPRTFQNDYMSAYDEVFIEDENGKPSKYRPGLLRSLDDFLRTWLNNIEHQGFDPVPKAENAE